MQRVVVDPAQIDAERLTLTIAQRHYLQRVLRLKAGDRFLALDGRGQIWAATLAPDGAQASLTPISTEAPSRSAHQPRITLAAGLPKQGFDEVVRQATELGADIIVPILSDRTLLRPSANKLQRWQRIATEAGEQSERLTVPIVKAPLTWPQWLDRESQDLRLICVARQPSAPSLLSVCLSTPATALEVAIGPEGGWTAAEIHHAIAHGYQPVALGASVLRAVTASITALSVLQAGIEFATINQFIDT